MTVSIGRMAGLVLLALAAAVPARAQNLNDLGRVLQDQVLGGGRPNPDRDRDAYERGRQEGADQARREHDARQRAYDDRRRFDEDRRRGDDDRRRGEDERRRVDGDRRQRDFERQQADQRRAQADEQRAREQSRRY